MSSRLLQDIWISLSNRVAVRRQYDLSASIFAKRAETIAKIPNFWPLVFEQAPPEIDQWISTQDSSILLEHLTNLHVSRPDLDNKGSGNPRSLRIRFEFSSNPYFEDEVLEKTFWARRSKDGTTGLVSEPVRINWKIGKDPTQGMTDLARALFEARTKLGDMTAKGLPEYTALKKKVENWNGMNTSFFTWFGWVSSHRWVSVEENEQAIEALKAEKAKRKDGGRVGPLDPATVDAEAEAEEALDDEAVEVHEAGDDLAIAIAEELWPSAIKYFTQAQEIEEMSDVDFEDDDMEEDDAEEGDEQPVDIRALVGKGRSRDSGGPPSKRQKT